MTPLLPEADRKAGLPPLAETGWAAVPGKDAIEPPPGLDQPLQRGGRDADHPFRQGPDAAGH